MSTEPHTATAPAPTAAKHEHGTMISYIVGFILSLILTFNAYILVVGKLLHGNALLVAILTLGVLQMAVQLIFFLHLGRGPKPMYNIVFFFATAGIIVVTIGASLFIMTNLYSNGDPYEITQKLAQDESISQVGGVQTGACQELKVNHKVTLKDTQASPGFTQASRCDTLTFVNEDSEAADIVFGAYPALKNYGGKAGATVRAGGYPTVITLNQTGDFSYYNSANPATAGSFSVAP